MFKNQMIAKVKEGVKVRLIVDGKVNHYFGYSERVKDLEAAGVEVIRWEHPEVSYLIQHRKIMFIDGKSYIAGGINIGDTYSHQNPDTSVQRWRDTDIYVEGDAVAEAYRLFAKIWNQQIDWYGSKYRYEKIDMSRLPTVPTASAGQARVALIESMPGPWMADGSPILHAVMRAIRGAERTVDIENAYVILNPALREEIRAALKRGVKVRVFTNSDASVDEAVISKPIMKNARDLARMGAEVYLKEGATLHSKVMVVDSRLSIVKSYNFHPRSERTDGEMAVVVDDPVFGQQVTEMINADILPGKAKRVENWKDVRYNESWLDTIMLNLSMRIGYDVL
jgi:cardiolipin synthase